MFRPDILAQKPVQKQASQDTASDTPTVVEVLRRTVDTSQLPDSSEGLTPEARRDLEKKIENARLVTAAIALVRTIEFERGKREKTI